MAGMHDALVTTWDDDVAGKRHAIAQRGMFSNRDQTGLSTGNCRPHASASDALSRSASQSNNEST